MKKTIFILICIFAVNGSVFCLQEGYLTVGPSYKNINIFKGNTEPLGKEKGMFGSNVSCYGFWDGSNIGLFVYGAMVRPVYASRSDNRVSVIYSGLLQDYIFGAGFRLPLGTRFMLLYGFGLNIGVESISCFVINYQKFHNIDAVNLGFSGEAAIKFDITPKYNITPEWYLLFGLNASYSFLNYTNVNETYRKIDSGFAFQSVLGTDVFIGIGVNTMYDWSPKNK
jgi:hypothetical protein